MAVLIELHPLFAPTLAMRAVASEGSSAHLSPIAISARTAIGAFNVEK